MEKMEKKLNSGLYKDLLLQLRKAGFKRFPESELLSIEKACFIFPDEFEKEAKLYLKIRKKKGRITYLSSTNQLIEEYFYNSFVEEVIMEMKYQIILIKKVQKAKKVCSSCSETSYNKKNIKEFYREAGITPINIIFNKKTKSIELQKREDLS